MGQVKRHIFHFFRSTCATPLQSYPPFPHTSGHPRDKPTKVSSSFAISKFCNPRVSRLALHSYHPKFHVLFHVSCIISHCFDNYQSHLSTGSITHAASGLLQLSDCVDRMHTSHNPLPPASWYFFCVSWVIVMSGNRGIVACGSKKPISAKESRPER